MKNKAGDRFRIKTRSQDYDQVIKTRAQIDELIKEIQLLTDREKYYFPNREDVASLLKIPFSKFPKARKAALTQIRSLSRQRYPQVKWREIRTYKENYLTIFCKGIFYDCQARLRYDFDRKESCYYLRVCQNEHIHIPSKFKIYKNLGVEHCLKQPQLETLQLNEMILQSLEEVVASEKERKQEEKKLMCKKEQSSLNQLSRIQSAFRSNEKW